VNGAVAFVPYSYIEDYGAKPFSVVKGQPTGMSLNPKRERWFLPDSSMWLALPQIFGELKALEQVIIEDGEPLPVTAEKTPVQWLAKRVGKESYLIAVNPRASSETVAFALPTAVGKLEPMFGTPAAEAREGRLTLEFGRYEVKVFAVGR
jgi:hypothetical protein